MRPRTELLRLFSGFPNGRRGAGLFLLRVVLGIVVLRSLHNLTSVVDDSPWHRGVDAAGAMAGALILVGFLTPLAVLWVAGALVLSRPLAAFGTVDGLSALLLSCDCAVLALLGPGAWSVDARLFGHREIVIPRPSRRDRE